jgi:hypothetical protein
VSQTIAVCLAWTIPCIPDLCARESACRSQLRGSRRASSMRSSIGHTVIRRSTTHSLGRCRSNSKSHPIEPT